MKNVDLIGRPWAALPASLETWIAAAESRPLAAEPRAASAPRAGHRGVIELRGPITPQPSWLTALFGGTDLETFSAQFDAAVNDAAIATINILIDSPGGDVSGVSQVMDQVVAARSRKPVIANVVGTAASAAYFIASGASKIYTADTGRIGSIGVVGVVHDDRGFQEKIGIRRHEIVSAFAPLKRPDISTDAGRAVLQGEVDALERIFLSKVALNRGITVGDITSHQGGIMIGKHAVDAGLADGLLGATPPRVGGMETSHTSGAVLSVEERCKAEFAVDASLRAEFGSLSVYTAYMAALERGHIRVAGKRRHSQAPTGPVSQDISSTSIEERCRQAWNTDPQVRADFPSLAVYISYERALAAGKVRISGKPRL